MVRLAAVATERPRHQRQRSAGTASLRSSGAVSDAQVRTLQHRVKDWRSVMVKRLVYDAFDKHAVERPYRGKSELVGTGISG